MVQRRDILMTAATGTLTGSLLDLASEQTRGATGTQVQSNHDDFPNRGDDDRVWLVDADPDFGFNFPYWLATPETVRSGAVPLLFEMNNARRGESVEETKKHARYQNWALQGAWLSEELGVPMLVPVVPWPHGDPLDKSHSTISLDRETMFHEGTKYERLDVQLLQMAEHAKQEELTDIETHEKMLFYGNSSGGVAGERMAMLHPEEILAVAAGALNGIVVHPLEELGDHTLNYPVGVADVEDITGESFDSEAAEEVDRFFFQGGADEVDRLPTGDEGPGGDFADPDVLNTAQAVYGPDMVRNRFPRGHVAFEKTGIDAQFRVYPEMTHNPGPASHDILEFFRKSIGEEDVSEFGQRLELQLDREPKIVQQNDVEDGLEVEFTVSGSNPPPEGLVSYQWDFDDNSTADGLHVSNTFDELGTYDVTLTMETPHGQQAEKSMQFAYEMPVFDFEEHELSTETVVVGESIALTVTIKNTGNTAGEEQLTFAIDGDVTETVGVHIDENATEAVTFEYTFEAAGEYELSVNAESMRTVTVESDSTPTKTETETSTQTDEETVTRTDEGISSQANEAVPGFGVLTTFAGVGSVLGYLVCRKETKEQ